MNNNNGRIHNIDNAMDLSHLSEPQPPQVIFRVKFQSNAIPERLRKTISQEFLNAFFSLADIGLMPQPNGFSFAYHGMKLYYIGMHAEVALQNGEEIKTIYLELK
jgi:hypothetical protein